MVGAGRAAGGENVRAAGCTGSTGCGVAVGEGWAALALGVTLGVGGRGGIASTAGGGGAIAAGAAWAAEPAGRLLVASTTSPTIPSTAPTIAAIIASAFPIDRPRGATTSIDAEPSVAAVGTDGGSSARSDAVTTRAPGSDVASRQSAFERSMLAYLSRSSAASLIPSAMASWRCCARSATCSARNAATSAALVATFASTIACSMAWQLARGREALVGRVRERAHDDRRDGRVHGRRQRRRGLPLVSTWSVCTSVSASYGGLPESRW